jgi:hypothetical protein
MLQVKRFEMLLKLFLLADSLESGLLFKKSVGTSQRQILLAMGHCTTAKPLFDELYEMGIIEDGSDSNFVINKNELKLLIKNEPGFKIFYSCLERMGHSIV